MSRFFSRGYHYGGASSSDEEDLVSSDEEVLNSSSSEEDLESDDSFFNESESESAESDDESDSKPYGPDWFKKPEFRKGGAGSSSASKFLKGSNNYSGSDDSDEEDKKVVKSAKDKLLDEMTASYNKIDAAEMTQDWVTILSEFENVSRLQMKASQQNFGTPNVFIRVISQVDQFVAENSQADLKNKAVAKAFNTVKQRVKKLVREYEALVSKLRENPELFEKEDIATFVDANLVGNAGAMKPLVSTSGNAGTSEFFNVLRVVIDSRGKKGTDIQSQIKTMVELLDTAGTVYETIVGYLNLIPIRFDACANLSYQSVDQWKSTYSDVSSLLSVLEANIGAYHVSELAPKNEFIEDQPAPNENGVIEILGSVFAFVERLDDEFNKSLLHTDPHSSDYLDRLRDEQKIYNLILRTQLYMEKVLPEDPSISSLHLSRPFIKRLDHVYYKSTKLVEIIEKAAWSQLPQGSSSTFITYSADGTVQEQNNKEDGESEEDDANKPKQAYPFRLIDTLCKFVSDESRDALLRRRATLYQIYFHALNNDFTTAKEWLVQSGVRNAINSQDPSIQILFNRVVVQLGLAAFKLCLVEDAHQILNEVSTSSHLRDILGQQSLQRATNNLGNSSKTSTDQICLPFHLHINLDLIDAVFMTCSLLVEIPHMAAFFSGIKVKRIPFSQKSVRRAIEHFDKSNFQGSPETLKDHIVHAAKAMQKGNWEQCIKFLKGISAWPLLCDNIDQVFEKLTERIQVESLKTYIFTYKRFYSRLSIDRLAEFFSLPREHVLEIVDELIASIDIKASLNDTKTMLVFEKGDEITKLEEVAIRLNKESKYHSERLNNYSQR